AFIRKLTDMGHASPMEHASFTFGIQGVSRALLAQITRHRIASFSVQSQRYVGKKSRETFDYIMPPAIFELGEEAQQRYARQMDQIQQWYNEWCDALGDAGEKSNEDARFVLPNAAETKMMVTMNVRELRHFFNLRCCERTQWEIRGLAWQMLALCQRIAPELFALGGPGCVAGACPEGRMSCGRSVQVRERAQQICRAAHSERDERALFEAVAALVGAEKKGQNA
ncbi:MAG: FAD-dependent thymidylate synthase, partial [Christensenellales bacterium]